jgi:hypothetical protein
MKKTLLFTVVVIALSTPLQPRADEYVHGYTRSNGTIVQGYIRSSPDGTVTDNYSYDGNTNPYTGKVGSDRYIHDATSPYYQGPDSQGNIGHSTSTDPSFGSGDDATPSPDAEPSDDDAASGSDDE